MLLGYLFDDVSAGMFESAGTAGIVWAWIFNIMMVLVLLNMVLAIIFDVYSDVKSDAGDAPSLIGQTFEVIEEKRNKTKKLRAIKEELDRAAELKQKASEVTEIYADLAEGRSPGVIVEQVDDVEDMEVTAFDDEPDQEPKCDDPDDKVRDVKGSKGSVGSPHSKEDEHEATPGSKRNTSLVDKLVKGKWTEAKLRDKLVVEDVHAKEVVTLDSLIQALNEADPGTAEDSDKPLLKLMMDGALEHSTKESEVKSMSLIDSIRLVGRIDANVRDFLAKMRKARALKEAKALDEDQDGNQISGPQLEDRFRRIEDAVAGLTHKLQVTIGPAPPVPLQAVAPPVAPANGMPRMMKA
jgi:hypothetical protein